MTSNYITILLGGLVASIVWFVIGGVLYQNPYVAKLYKEEENSQGLRKWTNIPKYLFLQYLGILIQCVLWAFIYAFIKPILSEELLRGVIILGILLMMIKVIPRFIDMWIQSTYPIILLFVEFINGTIGCFIIGLVFFLIIK
jgi:hypothetical protein